MSSKHPSCGLQLAGAFAAGVALVSTGAPAHAASTGVTIDSRSPSLTERDEGGWTSALGFTNLTDAEVTLEVSKKNASDLGCDPSLDKVAMPAAEHQAVVLSIPGRCEVTDDGFPFTVRALRADEPVATFEVLAGPKPAPTKPDWDELQVFGWLLAGLTLLALVLAAVVGHGSKDGGTLVLKHVDESWSFTGSWVSNLTFVAAFATAIFGSAEVVKVALGENADSSIALATVGGAVAAAFAGAGPVVLIALKDWKDGTYTALGLLCASAVTLAGALGELWILNKTGGNLDLGGMESFLTGALVTAAVLLLAYAVSTLHQLLKVYVPPPQEDSDTIRAAQMIVAALRKAAVAETAIAEAESDASVREAAEQATLEANNTIAEAQQATAAALRTLGRARPRPRAAIL
jgi:hypothetical protein